MLRLQPAAGGTDADIVFVSDLAACMDVLCRTYHGL